MVYILEILQRFLFLFFWVFDKNNENKFWVFVLPGNLLPASMVVFWRQSAVLKNLGSQRYLGSNSGSETYHTYCVRPVP